MTQSAAPGLFFDDPFAPVSGQFALRGTSFNEDDRHVPSSPEARPFGLRRMVPARPAASLPPAQYSPVHQMSVLTDGTGRFLLDTANQQPTAIPTSPVDGEDPPSSTDWTND
ncbi:putative ATP-grasp-modified RiPP [Crossiella sp. CA198]|uniref:putative ATP-grasp-modified RiPP n=1 Tax=Crossiella sp. CA198 TaxID=3455607 RepID=UPI003F8D8BEC